MTGLIDLDKLKEIGELKLQEKKAEEKRKCEEQFREFEETVKKYTELIKEDHELISYLESIITAEISAGYNTAKCSPKNVEKYNNIHAFKNALKSCCPDIEFTVVAETVSNYYIDSISYTRYVIMMSWD